MPVSSEGQIADIAPAQEMRAAPVLERINEESEHEYSNKDQNSSVSSNRDIEESKQAGPNFAAKPPTNMFVGIQPGLEDVHHQGIRPAQGNNSHMNWPQLLGELSRQDTPAFNCSGANVILNRRPAPVQQGVTIIQSNNAELYSFKAMSR
jgi:hypothetical protein